MAVVLLPIRHYVQYTGQRENVYEPTQRAGEPCQEIVENSEMIRRLATKGLIYLILIPRYCADLRQKDGEYNADGQQGHVE